MATASGRCFNCGKPPSIFFDFLAVEKLLHSTTSRSGGAVWKTTQSNERLAGFVRIPLCGGCMQRRLMIHINALTRKSGSPILTKGKEVAFSRELLARMQQGIYENTDAMKLLFILETNRANYEKLSAISGADFTDMIKMADKNTLLSSHPNNPLGYSLSLPNHRIEKIGPEYVLFSFEQFQSGRPFAQPLMHTMGDSSFDLCFADLMDSALPDRWLSNKQALKNIYNQLKSI